MGHWSKARLSFSKAVLRLCRKLCRGGSSSLSCSTINEVTSMAYQVYGYAQYKLSRKESASFVETSCSFGHYLDFCYAISVLFFDQQTPKKVTEPGLRFTYA
mmetsp:Transcript_4947/g.6705  ORF Transcript_4947/g.6705 Transcript_4947/m.6705 type:complete len:102 (-) Transcript_4947:74-379(-)